MVKPIEGVNINNRLQYDALFTSEKYHLVQNKLSCTNHLNDAVFTRLRPEGRFIELLPNSSLPDDRGTKPRIRQT